MSIVEIKPDLSTLPSDGDKVRFHIPKDGWKEGVYVAKERLFSFNDGDFHYWWEASEWELITKTNS